MFASRSFVLKSDEYISVLFCFFWINLDKIGFVFGFMWINVDSLLNFLEVAKLMLDEKLEVCLDWFVSLNVAQFEYKECFIIICSDFSFCLPL